MEVSMGMTILSQKKIERSEFDRRMEEHAKWLKNDKEGQRADFSDFDLSSMDLSGMDFSYAEMRGVNLSNANLKTLIFHMQIFGNRIYTRPI